MLRFLAILGICVALVQRPFAFAAEDAVDGEDEDGTVEDETEQAERGKAVVPPSDKDLDAEDDIKIIGPSPDAEAYVLFTQPADPKELPAGGTVRMLIGFSNKAKEPFFVETIDAAFHFPMDHSFHVRNFTHSPINRLIEAGTEASFAYGIMPSEDLAGRPFGFRINLNYRDLQGTKFANAVFNETINIIDDESGVTAEAAFMYVFMGCLVILLLLLGQHFLQKMRKKAGMGGKKKEAPVEMGTTGNSDIDWEWIPKEVLNHANKSPRLPGSPKKSPRQRAAGKAGGKKRGDSGDSDDYES